MKPKIVKIMSEHYLENMTSTMKNMLQDELLTDVTLCCKEGSVKAHKLILASASPCLRKIFLNNPGSQISLVLFGVNVSLLQCLVDLIYKGNLDLPREKAIAVYNLAEELEISKVHIDDGPAESDFNLGKVPVQERKRARIDLNDSENGVQTGRPDISGRRSSTSSEKTEKEHIQLSKTARGVSDISVVVPRINLEETSRHNVWAVKERKYKCDDCPACFKRASHLSRHQLVHTGERPYVCEYCDKAYSRHDKLKHHLRIIHGVIDDLTQLNAELPSDSLYTIGHVQILSEEHEDTDLSAPIHQEDLPPPTQSTNNRLKVEDSGSYEMPDLLFPQKKRRGRPRKNPPKLPIMKRPRGRPPCKATDKKSSKRPRGRPRVKPIDPNTKKRPRGRPRVNPVGAFHLTSHPPIRAIATELKELSPSFREDQHIAICIEKPMVDNSSSVMEPLVEIKTEVPDPVRTENVMPILLQQQGDLSFLHSVGLYESRSMVKLGENKDAMEKLIP